MAKMKIPEPFSDESKHIVSSLEHLYLTDDERYELLSNIKTVEIYREHGLAELERLISNSRKTKKRSDIIKKLNDCRNGLAQIDETVMKEVEQQLSAEIMIKSFELIDTLDEEKMKDAKVRDVVNAFSTLFSTARLLQGKSTENVSVNNITSLITATNVKPEIELNADDVEVK